MKKGIKYICLLIGLIPTFVFAQTKMELDFPTCQYLQYSLALKLGSKLDTIAKGRIDEHGKASFTLPEKYALHRGVGNLSVPFCNKNINLIVNGEENISLKEQADNLSEVLIANSKENLYLKELLAKQGKLLQEYNAVMAGESNSALIFSLLAVSKANLEKGYINFWAELADETLYAPQMAKLLSYLSGLGSSLTLSQEEVNQELVKHIVETLDFKDLYTSGFWNMTLETWCRISMTDDSLFVDQARQMLSRTADVPTRRELTNYIIQLFSKYGKDNLLMELGSEYLTIPINGKPAPELVTDGAPIQPKSSLIIFYDTDCGLCHNELNQMKEKYSLLSNDHNQIEIISVSADTNKDVFEDLSSSFPWKDKLCNLDGFAGKNFENYGIVGTPTIVLVDKEGIVRGRYARLSEFLKGTE